jgi:hypothetical protein
MNRWTMVGVVLSVAAAAWYFGAASAPKAAASRNEDALLAHNVFFTLKEDTDEAKKKLIANCKKYLVNHPGVVYFAVGPRVPDLDRDVNDKEFHVGLHIVFKDKASHDKYQPAPDHEKFKQAIAGTIKTVKVFDTYIEPVTPEKKAD